MQLQSRVKCKSKKYVRILTSLVVQWFQNLPSSAGDAVLISSWGTKPMGCKGEADTLQLEDAYAPQ